MSNSEDSDPIFLDKYGFECKPANLCDIHGFAQGIQHEIDLLVEHHLKDFPNLPASQLHKIAELANHIISYTSLILRTRRNNIPKDDWKQ